MADIPGTNAFGVDIDAQIAAVQKMETNARVQIFEAHDKKIEFWRAREMVLRAILVTLRQVKEMQTRG